ncbi:MAG: hypothetical protein GYB54_02640 [Gammaproteobacteria bacterium]|nr:hypothetical protein [Gammaproteobacteria bacterium]
MPITTVAALACQSLVFNFGGEMPAISPPPMTRPEAQYGVVHHMLIEHGRNKASELFLINGKAYRLTVEKVAHDDMPAATRQMIQEMTDETVDH